MDMMSNNKLYMIIISDFKIQREALVLKKLCKIEVAIGKTYLKCKILAFSLGGQFSFGFERSRHAASKNRLFDGRI